MKQYFLFTVAMAVIQCHSNNSNSQIEFSQKRILNDSTITLLISEIESDTLKILVEKSNALGERDGFSINEGYIKPKILLSDRIIYEDFSNAAYYISFQKIHQVKVKENIIYLLVEKFDPIEGNKFVIIRINRKKEINIYISLAELFNDIDNDGFIEVGGFPMIEYDPNLPENLLMPEISELGIDYQFDSLATLIYYNNR